jgi:hypothetical protein
MIGVVHLVWAPLGPQPLREFLRSYRVSPAGLAHELVVVLNGLAAGPTREQALGELARELQEVPHRLIALEHPVLDLAAYGQAARGLEHERLCFLNSYSVILGQDWLAHLARALDAPSVGLVGASGSWESQAEWVRGRARYWPYQLAGLRAARRDYPRFPNPHIRTTGFMLDRNDVEEMRLERVRDKREAYRLESGQRSITRMVEESGRSTAVVGRDGRRYDGGEWPDSRTYRSGAQENLLIADNRTREWQASPRGVRMRLSRDAWGERAFL